MASHTWAIDETNELISTASVCICPHLCCCDSTHQAVHHPVLPPHLWHELGDVDLRFPHRRLLVLVHYCVPRLLPTVIILLDAVSGPQGWQMYLQPLPNVATDGITLMVPIPLVWKLQLQTAQKILASGIFLLGGLYVALSLVNEQGATLTIAVFASRASSESFL